MDFVLRYFDEPPAARSPIYFWGLGPGPFLVSPGEVDARWKIKAVADIDQDGVSDIIWQFEETPNYAIWAINRLSSTTASVHVVRGSALLAAEPESGWELIGAADVDHYQLLDGGMLRVDARPLAPDLFYRNRTDGTLRLRRMVWANGGYVRHPNPDPVLFTEEPDDPGVMAAMGVHWTLVSTADLNNDGFADLTWQCTGSACGAEAGHLVVWVRQGFESFGRGMPKDSFQYMPIPFDCFGADPCHVPEDGNWSVVAPR
jgi:hypothetical protein